MTDDTKTWLTNHLQGRAVSTKLLFKKAGIAGHNKFVVIKALKELDCSIVRSNNNGKEFYWCLSSGLKRWIVVDFKKPDWFPQDLVDRALAKYTKVDRPSNGVPLPKMWFMYGDTYYWCEEG